MAKSSSDIFVERTRSNIGKRGFFYFTPTLSIFLYMIIPVVALCSFVGFLAVNFKTEQERIDYLQHFGNSAYNLTSAYSGKVINMVNSDKLAAEESTEMVHGKLRSFFTFTELNYAIIVTSMIGLVIYMRVVVMTKLIIFTWLRRLIFGAIPDDFMLIDFLTLKKERTVENVKALIDQLFEITKLKIQDIDTIIVDTTNKDSVIDGLMVHFGDKKVVSLCEMNISSFTLVKDTLPKKSRALIVTNNGNKDTTVVLVSNNPKDNKISKYTLVKSETVVVSDNSESDVSSAWKNSKCSHLCLGISEEKLNKAKNDLEETVLEPTLTSSAHFGANTTSFNALEFIENERKGKRNDLILQMNCGTNSITKIIWKVI